MIQFTEDNFEQKNERPWPNPYLDRAAIVGHTTATTCRLWLRTDRAGIFTLFYFPLEQQKQNTLSAVLVRVPFDSSNLPDNTVPREVSVSAEKDTTVVLELNGLEPDTAYQYIAADMRANPPRVILGHDRIHQFRTLPVEESSFSFALYSCHMPYKDSLFGSPRIVNMEMWEYLHAMLDRHQQKDLRFIIAGGDQMYSDGVDSLSIWQFLKKHMRKVNGKLLPEESAMRGWYRDIYRGYWGISQIRKIFSNFPMYMMWDDHELMDGWGSRYLSGPGDENDEMDRIFGDYTAKGLDYSDCRTLLNRMEAAAKTVYEEYQHSHNPVTKSGVYDYGFQHDRTAFYMLDGRGYRDINRSSHRILGREQLARFKRWVEALDDRTGCLFVTSAVPLLHLASSVSNMDDSWLAHIAGLEDDLRDAWENDLHTEERRELLHILFAAARRGIGVCILSGDVHMAAAFRMQDRETGKIIYQLTSSAITYNIPRAFSWALGTTVEDSGTSDDGYAYQRLALYKQSNFSLIKVDQDNRRIIFQIYGEQETAHPREEVTLPMTHSIAKLELGFNS